MISVAITARALLPEDTIHKMFALHCRYFAGTDERRFRLDLSEKDWVITLLDAGILAGFSTQKLIHLPIDGRPCQFLFSGDTVVDQPYWNQPGLAGGWGHLAMKLADECKDQPLYWFLICKGFRTYRFLSTFFLNYHPRPAESVDTASLRTCLDAVATARYCTAYDPISGIIRLSGPHDRLAGNWANVAAHRLKDIHVDYFLKANAGWHNGDELACIAPIRRDNLNRLGHRIIRTTNVIWHGV